MKKILAIVCVLCTFMTCMVGCSEDAKHIGNPYVPEYFTLEGVDYHMESDNIPQKLEENGWSFTPDGNTVTVYKDIEYQKNKSQKGYHHSEFQMILKKDAAKYETPSEYVVTNIIFKEGDLWVTFNVFGVKFDSVYEDVHRKFGASADIGYMEDTEMPISLTYSGKTRAMVATFENMRLVQYNFSL